jgi:hypothetical protein
MVLLDASPMKRIAQDAPVAEFEIVKLLPPVFKPSMVTLSAPFRSIKRPTIEPETVIAEPASGLIDKDE